MSWLYVADTGWAWQRGIVDPALESVVIRHRDEEELLDEFHGGVYWGAFPGQQEPLAVWKRALWSGAPYELTIRIVGHELRDPVRCRIAGGVVHERYPRTGCGLITYLVVAPWARRHGLGRSLQDETAGALLAAGAPAVFGEINDPRLAGQGVIEPIEVMWRRVERNQAWGARVVNMRYVQPAQGPGLERERGRCLIVFPGEQPLGPTLPGPTVRGFLEDLYAAFEGVAPDRELVAAIPEQVELLELRR